SMTNRPPQIMQETLVMKSGPHCVLMIHGLGSGPLELSRLAKDLHLQGFSVEVPNIESYCFGGTQKKYIDWIDEVKSNFWRLSKEYDTVSIVGISMGATLAIELAKTELANAVVLLATALAFDGWAMPWYKFLIDWAHLIPFSNRYVYTEHEPYGLKNEETRYLVKRMMELNDFSESGAATLSLNQITEGRKLIKHVSRDLGYLKVPILVMHAVDDESVHISNAERFFSRLNTSYKEFIYLGDSYHMITIDNERDVVHKQTSRFLKTMVNQISPEPAFELANPITPQLIKYLKKSR
ncbi:MAG: alpha/beta fold hydrolase, partial [Betaproteobacteria bacterium]